MKELGSNKETRVDRRLREEDLEHIDSMVYESNKDELLARTIFDMKTDVHEGAETVSYDTLTESGAAKVTANGADDIPLVDGDMTRASHGIVTIESGFKVKKQEKRAAAFADRPVDAGKAATARRVIAEKENSIVFKGNTEHGIQGATNAVGMLEYDVAAGESASTKWADKTGFEIVTDIRKARAKQKGIDGFNPDTLALTPEAYAELEQPLNQYNAQPIITYIRDMGWFERILEVKDLVGADPETGGDSLMLIDTDPSYLQLCVPMDITRNEPVLLPNSDEQIVLEERTAGLIIRYPQALLRVDGI